MKYCDQEGAKAHMLWLCQFGLRVVPIAPPGSREVRGPDPATVGRGCGALGGAGGPHEADAPGGGSRPNAPEKRTSTANKARTVSHLRNQ